MNMTGKELFTDGWEFGLFDVGTEISTLDNSVFKPVEIPHDWLIYDTNNLYKSGYGWYRKKFNVHNADRKKFCFALEFDGVYMDSTVYINGKAVGTWHYGYSSFEFDITDFLSDGENTVMVQVRHVAPNSRWYSGAGIFRNVYFITREKAHILSEGLYVHSDGESGNVKVFAETSCVPQKMVYTVFDMDKNAVITTEKDEFTIDSFTLWSLEKPYIYTLKADMYYDGKLCNSEETDFGFRVISFDAQKGFSLNGKHMKLKGMCMHHDLGALGSAVNYCATQRQLEIMKSMGVNAIRTSHNMPSREFLHICDRIGMMVDLESFDMWELSKTEFDNARFFKQTAHEDVKSWVRRDRNHPCVIMWSIGNEIYDTFLSERGVEVAKMLAGYVREFDFLCNAALTIGSNYIEWEHAQEIGKFLGQSGYNYAEKCYDEHHEKYPDTFIYGSETSSEVRSRGIYHFPADIPMLTNDDKQCSSLGNSTVTWGKPAEIAWIDDRDRDYVGGQFVWTGFDYIGEPTPYSTKNSYFGAVDTAGLPKDDFYLYQSVWTDMKENPMVHLLPYWDFNEGQIIDVIAFSNCPRIELLVNGKSFGVKNIDREHGKTCRCSWKVPYKKGSIKVNAMNESGTILACEERKSFGDGVKICTNADRKTISSDGEDLCFIEVYTCDKNGIAVENARNRINCTVTGAGRLLGMDNGDSTDYEQYKTDSRKLFSGKLIAIIGSDGTEGDIKISFTSDGLEKADLVINAKGGKCGRKLVPQISHAKSRHDIPVRKIEAVIEGDGKLDGNRKTAEVKYELLPENCTFKDIKCKIVKPNGIDTNIALAEISDGKITVTAAGDGECILRIYAYNNSEYPQIISDVAFEISGLGSAASNPYEMIYACRYSDSNVLQKLVENNALGGFSEACTIGFQSYDFGKIGTDKLRLYFGNNTGKDIPIEVYDGNPDNDGKLIMTAMFPHNSGWGCYKPFDFIMPNKLKNVHDIYIHVPKDCIFGGMEFTGEEKAYAELSPCDCDSIYGDDYIISESDVINIGNNVVISFTDMDFSCGTSRLEICGKTTNEINTIQLRYVSNGNEKTIPLEFPKSDEYTTVSFDIDSIVDKTDISFVFLPGSMFDFRSFRFIKI